MENKNNKLTTSALDRVTKAIEKLSTTDWNRIHKAARSFLFGTVFSDADELMNETLCRIISGDRNWPQNTPFMTFVINAMRSIADGDRNLIYKAKEVSAANFSNDESDLDYDPIENFGDDRFSPETIITSEIDNTLAKEDLKIIENHFKDNENVGWVLMGVEEELSASEILELSGMTKTQYESTRKSLLRGLDKLFPGRRIKK